MATPERPSRRRALIIANVVAVLVLLVVIGAALVFALRGNDDTSARQGASSTTTTGMSGAATSTTGPASPGSRVLIDGNAQDIGGSVSCKTGAGLLTINMGANVFVVLTDADPPVVNEVGLGNVEGVVLAYHAGSGDGDATVTKNDKTYKIVGHATGFDISHPLEGFASRAYEIDATCP
jgi:lipoprotein LpqH